MAAQIHDERRQIVHRQLRAGRGSLSSQPFEARQAFVDVEEVGQCRRYTIVSPTTGSPVIKTLLEHLGFVRASRYRSVVDRLSRSEARVEAGAAESAKLRERARDWKARADAAQQRLADVTAEGRQRDAELRALSSQFQRCNDEQHLLRKQLVEQAVQAADLTSLQQRLDDEQRQLAAARDELMAIDVKLDILEGAANVIDVRLRGEAPRSS